jgi:hypothetical protein
MAFSWENLKRDVKDNSPSSEAVVKSLGAAVVVYASVLGYWHRDTICQWTKDQWNRLTRKDEGEAETGQVNESV